MNKKLQVLKYITADIFSAVTAWTFFYCFRKLYIESEKYGTNVPVIFDEHFSRSLLIISFFWLLLYVLTGTYRNIYRKSRLREVGQTLLITVIGVIILFFLLLLDDEIQSYRNYYQSVITLFLLHFFITATLRFILSSITNHRIHNRIMGFNTILVGSNKNALNLYNEMQGQIKSSGNKFVGFVHVDNKNGYSQELIKNIPHLGELNELKKLIDQHNVEEVIIAIESSEHDNIGKIVNELDNGDLIIKVIPDMYDILSGSVKMTSIFGAALIEISREIMPAWQQSFKRIFDICVSIFVLTVFGWVYLIVAIAVKLNSKGPVFYSHERIGWHGKPFMIHKFRSMYVDAEKMGPALSSKHDPRITPLGRFLRKVRLDEIPQFYNVLIGEMSLVGPRPERQFFIDQIVQKAPHYKHLHKVRPGITSWGQVKYGYAENVDQMIERLKYDIIYIENMSLGIDLKILIYTALIVVQGRGK
ncbi:MAG: exopolysaccharide biosynthesis polyprenyl glycosylphosphotransferase [Bacteroidota bacterium]|jgi:exopolysaccharide biosynthesis polyprenyl glycosylphosphotransferase|nr:exopolysaccharide biosynthesis polyprenyl glycosylphosphotransferase [Bacteroidota bacterium]